MAKICVLYALIAMQLFTEDPTFYYRRSKSLHKKTKAAIKLIVKLFKLRDNHHLPLL